MFVLYIVEWAQSWGALVWHGQSKGFVVLLSSVGDARVQVVVCIEFHVWEVVEGVGYKQVLSCWW
jgi:hypothetical protein